MRLEVQQALHTSPVEARLGCRKGGLVLGVQAEPSCHSQDIHDDAGIVDVRDRRDAEHCAIQGSN
eukprot:14832322-Heterocapsa_arctica.AAC.1